jgi:glyoxylase-like metal-dependent hydrolase (beta-lactamase superfamily II)
LDGLKEKTDHVMDYLINTHHHGDHTAGNPVFKGFAKHIVAHQNVPDLQKRSAEIQ